MWENNTKNIQVCEQGNPRLIKKRIRERRCVVCGDILCQYNLGKKCFRHPEEVRFYVTTRYGELRRKATMNVKKVRNPYGNKKHKASASARHRH